MNDTNSAHSMTSTPATTTPEWEWEWDEIFSVIPQKSWRIFCWYESRKHRIWIFIWKMGNSFKMPAFILTRAQFYERSNVKWLELFVLDRLLINTFKKKKENNNTFANRNYFRFTPASVSKYINILCSVFKIGFQTTFLSFTKRSNNNFIHLSDLYIKSHRIKTDNHCYYCDKKTNRNFFLTKISMDFRFTV